MPRTPWESASTVSSGFYKKKLRSCKPPGGITAFPASEIERFLPRTNEKDALAGAAASAHQRAKSTGGPDGEVRYSGLLRAR